MAFAAFLVLTTLASLNRETGALLVGLYWAFNGLRRETVALFVLWAGITIGLHLLYGAAPAQFGGLTGTFAMNRETLPSAVFANVLFIPLWIAVVRGWRGAPVLFKRLALVAVPYVLAFLVGAIWQEVRLLLPMFPLILPMMLSERNQTRL